MKKITVILLLSLFPIIINAQYFRNSEGIFDGRFGITVGVNGIDVDTNFISAKSTLGFTIGVVGTAQISERFELFMGINFIRHNVQFLGRENAFANPEYIKYNLDKFDVPLVVDFAYLVTDDYKFGVQFGAAASFFHTFALKDDSKSEYLLDPLQLTAYDLKFEERNEKISFDTYMIFGLSAQYQNFMLTARYNKGLSDPYRNLPVFSPFMELTGKDNFTSLTFTYFFGENSY